MRKTTIASVAIGVGLLTGAGAMPSAEKEYLTSFVVTEQRDGQQIVLAAPSLTTQESDEGSFLAGGEQIDPETKRAIPYGVQARVKVREVADGKLRVSLSFTNSDLDSVSEADFVIREVGVHCVRTVTPREAIKIDLGGNRTVTISVTPTAPMR